MQVDIGDTFTDYQGRSFTLLGPLIFGGFEQYYKISRPPYYIEKYYTLYGSRAVLVEKNLHTVVEKSRKRYTIDGLFFE